MANGEDFRRRQRIMERAQQRRGLIQQRGPYGPNQPITLPGERGGMGQPFWDSPDTGPGPGDPSGQEPTYAPRGYGGYGRGIAPMLNPGAMGFDLVGNAARGFGGAMQGAMGQIGAINAGNAARMGQAGDRNLILQMMEMIGGGGSQQEPGGYRFLRPDGTPFGGVGPEGTYNTGIQQRRAWGPKSRAGARQRLGLRRRGPPQRPGTRSGGRGTMPPGYQDPRGGPPGQPFMPSPIGPMPGGGQQPGGGGAVLPEPGGGGMTALGLNASDQLLGENAATFTALDREGTAVDRLLQFATERGQGRAGVGGMGLSNQMAGLGRQRQGNDIQQLLSLLLGRV